MVIQIRFAEPADQPALVEFIRDHWSSTHVFAERPDVFDWQYGTGPRVNVIFAADVRDRSETAMTQNHVYEVCRLSLEAQTKAVRIGAGPAAGG